MLNVMKRGILLLCCLVLPACVYQAGIKEEFNKSVKEYNRLLRWHEVSTAGALYMVPEEYDAFIAAAEKVNTKDLSITDYRILTSECLTEKGTGDAVVEFDYYLLPSNRVKTLIYKQEWTYRESGGSKTWKIKSALPLFK